MEKKDIALFVQNSNYKTGKTFSEVMDECRDFINSTSISVINVSHTYNSNGDLSIMVAYSEKEAYYEV